MTINIFDRLNVRNGVISNMNKEKNLTSFQKELLKFYEKNPDIMDIWKVLKG